MNVPLPHACFPHGDTIPFTVTMATDEQGKPWGPSSLSPKDALFIKITSTEGVHWNSELVPVTGTAASYTLLFDTRYRLRGQYRYALQLCRAKDNNTWKYANTYTLLSGTFTLT